jgi:hypothetical protein
MSIPKFPKSAWRGVFQDYLTAVEASTEAPPEFHFANLVAVAGILHGRRAYVQNPNAAYFNFAVCCVAETAHDRKTTAQNLAIRVIPVPYPHLFSVLRGTMGSGEGLLEAVQDDNQGKGHYALAVVDEFSAPLRKCTNKGSTLAENMNQLLDASTPLALRTRTNPVHCTDALLGMTASSTPSAMADTLTEELVSLGLANRILYFMGKAAHPIPNPPPPDPALLNKVSQKIMAAASRATGAISFDPAADAHWQTLYVQRWNRNPATELERALTARIDSHMVRLAGLYASLEGTSAIHVDHLQAAVDVGLYCEAVALELAGYIGRCADAVVEQRVAAFLKSRAGAAMRREVHQAVSGRVSGDKLSRILNGMADCGLITISGPTIILIP